MVQEESEIISLIKDMQKRLTYLERKIDTLLNQFSERLSSSKSYYQPPRTYGRTPQYSKEGENRHGTRSARSGNTFDKKRAEEPRSAPRKRKPYSPGKERQSKP